MVIELKGVALITGAGGGIGRASVLQFIRDGCRRLIITDIVETILKETAEHAKELDGDVEIEAVVGDISSEEFVERLFSRTKTVFGRLDYAVNCAGVGGGTGPTAELTFADFKKAQAVNFEGLWLCERAELRIMMEQDIVNGVRGSIVNVASVAGVVGFPNLGPYVTSKHAATGLTKCDAITYGPSGIRVNTVSPGLIETPMTAKVDEKAKEEMVSHAAMKRIGQASEVASVIAFLLSARASFITGTNVFVDGGYAVR